MARFAGPSGQAAQKEIVCQNCGGHTTFTGTLTALRCPYCATPIQRDDVHDAPDRLPIDAVLPFRMDEANARAEVDKWINGRWFAPVLPTPAVSTRGGHGRIFPAAFKIWKGT